jgi:hypothetical protein
MSQFLFNMQWFAERSFYGRHIEAYQKLGEKCGLSVEKQSSQERFRDIKSKRAEFPAGLFCLLPAALGTIIPQHLPNVIAQAPERFCNAWSLIEGGVKFIGQLVQQPLLVV